MITIYNKFATFAVKNMNTETRIQQRFQKALVTYNLINDGDKILVGLSGGKDSLCLLELLAKRSRIHRPAFNVEALHVRMKNIHYETDTKYLETFCKNLSVPLHVTTVHFEEKQNLKKPKPPCFLCSWERRKQLFLTAQQLGCNKIALGHHQDDIINTALMNLNFEGSFSSMPPLLRMIKMPLTIIRPLCLEHESDIIEYARERGYEKPLKLCPFEKATKRNSAAKLFEHMERINPEARYSIWHALEKQRKERQE